MKYYIRRMVVLMGIFGVPAVILFCKLYTVLIHFLWAIGLS